MDKKRYFVKNLKKPHPEVAEMNILLNIEFAQKCFKTLIYQGFGDKKRKRISNYVYILKSSKKIEHFIFAIMASVKIAKKGILYFALW